MSTPPAEGRSPDQGATATPSGDNRKHSASPARDNVADTESGEIATIVNPPPLPRGIPPPPAKNSPPLPKEAPPGDDGWEALFDAASGRWYFVNRYTRVTQWENPRVQGPEGQSPQPDYGAYDSAGNTLQPTTATSAAPPPASSPAQPVRKYGGYNPKIHGNWDPNADYAKAAEQEEEEIEAANAAAAAAAAGYPVQSQSGDYTMQAHFNRFTGRFQAPGAGPEYHNDENKSKRQLNNFFDVDAAANSHNGRSLKEERRNKPINKKQLQAYKKQRHEKKEEKRRAWLKD